MKNLDLSAMGVEEMNQREMKEVNGGGVLTFMAICAVVLLVAGFVIAYQETH